jgi:RNA polymerase sigma-70 factor (ECF subfamily)
MDGVISWFQDSMQEDNLRFLDGLHRRDPNVVDALIERYQHRLLRYLLSLTGNRTETEDLFQETWVRVLEHGDQYRSQWKFEVWLLGIARNLVIDQARRKKGVSLDELMDPEAGTGFEPAAQGPSPLDYLAAGQDSVHIQRMLSELPAVYREVVILRFREDLALEEIATIISAPLSTVKSRLYRGLEGLRRIMGPSL